MSELVPFLGRLFLELGLDVTTLAGLFTRFAMLFLLMPGMAGRSVPVQVRLSLASALMVLLYPFAGPVPEREGAQLAALIGGEAFIGFTLGFSVRVLVFALDVAGAIIAQALSLSQIFGVTAEGDSASLLSTALTMGASVLFLTAGLEIAAIELFLRQLEAVPIGSFAALDLGIVAEEMTALGASAIAFGVTLALPFMVLNFTYYLLLGFLNRAMPQLMVTFVGLPAITMSGLVLLFLTAGGILTVWLGRMGGVLLP